MKTQLASDYAGNDANLVKLTATVWDVVEALTGCTDGIAGMKTTLEWLTAKITMLEECKDLISRSQRINIKIIGVEESAGSCFLPLKEALRLEKEPLVDQSHLQPKPKPGDQPRVIEASLLQ